MTQDVSALRWWLHDYKSWLFDLCDKFGHHGIYIKRTHFIQRKIFRQEFKEDQIVKNNLKIAGYGIFGLLGLWLAGALWAVTWIDKQALIDFPNKAELNVARLFWSTSPAIDQTHDADRALKFSWLRVSTEINRKERKQISNIIDVLAEEFLFTAKYFERHGSTMSPDINFRVAVLLLTYLNRLEMFQSYANPALESRLMEFSSNVEYASPSTQENWQREMMIRSRMKGDQSAYQGHREVLLRILASHANNTPKPFLEGIVNFL